MHSFEFYLLIMYVRIWFNLKFQVSKRTCPYSYPRNRDKSGLFFFSREVNIGNCILYYFGGRTVGRLQLVFLTSQLVTLMQMIFKTLNKNSNNNFWTANFCPWQYFFFRQKPFYGFIIWGLVNSCIQNCNKNVCGQQRTSQHYSPPTRRQLAWCCQLAVNYSNIHLKENFK